MFGRGYENCPEFGSVSHSFVLCELCSLLKNLKVIVKCRRAIKALFKVTLICVLSVNFKLDSLSCSFTSMIKYST